MGCGSPKVVTAPWWDIPILILQDVNRIEKVRAVLVISFQTP